MAKIKKLFYNITLDLFIIRVNYENDINCIKWSRCKNDLVLSSEKKCSPGLVDRWVDGSKSRFKDANSNQKIIK